MYTSHKIKAHNRCLCVLEMIQRANNLMEDRRGKLMAYEQARWDSIERLMYNREDLRRDFDKYLSIKKRLVSAYNNLLTIINQ